MVVICRAFPVEDLDDSEYLFFSINSKGTCLDVYKERKYAYGFVFQSVKMLSL